MVIEFFFFFINGGITAPPPQLNFWVVHMNMILTILPIEAHLSLVLLLALQSFVHLLDYTLIGLGSMEEAAGTSFLHHLGPNKAGQLTKPVRAVHDGVAIATLGVSQQEVTVCKGHKRSWR